jgi:hypothetical protein
MLIAEDTSSTRAADGFQCPVGPGGTGEGYYVARGYRPNGHLGEDWNGIRGGDSDLGDPIYATAHGIVVFAKNYHAGWGNVVIIRHAYHEGLSLKYVDSLYGHLLDFKVQEGDQVRRGQLIGRLGSNNGMYDAHLHFEMRKNLQIGMYRSGFPRDFTNYHSPSDFIAANRICDRGNRTVKVPINTFPANAPPSYIASKVHTPVYSPGTAPANPAITSEPVLPPARITAEPAPLVRLPVETPASTPAPAPVVVTKPTSAPMSTPKLKSRKASSTAPEKKTEGEEPPVSSAEKSTAKSKTPPRPTPMVTSVAKVETTPAPKTINKTTAVGKSTPAPAAGKVVATAGPKSQPRRSPAAKPITPIALEPDSVEPPLPLDPTPPTQDAESPIRRGSGNFQVDRFPDMRGKGY